MYAASFFKRVVNIPLSLCLVVGGVMSGALSLGGVMTVSVALLSTFCMETLNCSRSFVLKVSRVVR